MFAARQRAGQMARQLQRTARGYASDAHKPAAAASESFGVSLPLPPLRRRRHCRCCCCSHLEERTLGRVSAGVAHPLASRALRSQPLPV